MAATPPRTIQQINFYVGPVNVVIFSPKYNNTILRHRNRVFSDQQFCKQDGVTCSGLVCIHLEKDTNRQKDTFTKSFVK